MQRISPFLWFDTQAEEAAQFYTSIFADSKIVNVSRYSEGGPGPAGQVMVVDFEISGQRFLALNGGPRFRFTEAISFTIDCDTQEEVDYYWERLISGGGAESMCGWLRDQFGLSWQVVPRSLGRLMSDPDPAKSKRVMEAMLKMRKMNIAVLQAAYDANE